MRMEQQHLHLSSSAACYKSIGGNQSSNSTADHSMLLLRLTIWSHVFMTEEGEIYKPLGPHNWFIFVFNVICCLLGLPANVRVITKLLAVTRKDVAWRPRHALLLTTIATCIFILVAQCVIPCVYYWWRNETLCLVFMFLYCIPYLQFLFNLLLCLVDRYVAITRSVWHRAKIAKLRAFGWLFLIHLSLALIFKWFFIAGFVAIDCAIHFVHATTVGVTFTLLFVLCTGFLVAVFVLTWRNLPRASRVIRAAQFFSSNNVSSDRERQEEIELLPLAADAAAAGRIIPSQSSSSSRKSSNSSSRSDAMSVHVSPGHLRRLELEVTKQFLFTFVPLFAIFVICLFFSLYLIPMCLYFDSNGPTCRKLISYIPYMDMVMPLHALLYPVANLLFNKELLSAFSFPFHCSNGYYCCCCCC